MSLATRCTACGTVFRVVQDQLRVSSGWVRCGRCGEVFNAIESLVDTGMGPAPATGAPSVHASRVMDDLARVARAAEPISPAVRDDATGPAAPEPPVPEPPVPAIDLAASVPARQAIEGPAPGASALPPRPDQGPAPANALPGEGAPAAPGGGKPDGDADADRQRVAGGDGEGDGGGDDGGIVRPEPALPPTFVRQVDRAARWRHPGVRAVLALACAAAAALLVWQVHGTHHDWLAARWPSAGAATAWLCRWQGCRVEAPRRIDALAVESSGLVRTDAPGSYRLTIGLRNRADMPVRWPAVDLVLTDADGRTAARRILLPQELGVGADRLGPGAEASIAARLRVTGGPVVGYTIEIFYP